MRLTFERLADYRGLLTMVDGSFDPLHPGHLAYFRAARSLGRPLLVNLCPDHETARKHPILLPAEDRAEILDHLDLVTYVHVSTRPTTEILRQLRPASYVKGLDWRDRLPVAIGQVCNELGIDIRYTDTKTGSSSALLQQFQPDVDAFEQLVLNQKPADKPWEPVTDYSFEARKAIEGRHPELIRDVLLAGSEAALLDYGCGPGHLVRLLRACGVRAYGYEPHVRPEPDAERWCCSASQMRAQAARGEFAVVVCREVGEHCTLRDLATLIRTLCTLPTRYVYMTMRLNLSPRHILDVQTSDNLDPTHIALPPKDLVRVLFALEGFRRRADLEDRMDHQKQGRCFVYERAA